MNIKRKSKGTPEQMLEAFETKINELEGVGSVESSTHLDESDYIDGSGNNFNIGDAVVDLDTERPGEVIDFDEEANEYLVAFDDGDEGWVHLIDLAPVDDSIESTTSITSSSEFKGTIGDRVKEKHTDTFDVGTIIEVDTENSRYLVEYDYTDFENPRWEDGSSIEEWTPELEEYYNNRVTSSTDSVRQQDYAALVAQGMTPDEAWAEIENYDYSDDYDDIDASTNVIAADEVTDSEYLEKLCEYVTINLDDAGYEATAYIKDGYLVIESMYDAESQFIQDIEEIEPNWDDLDSDAQELSDAYIEKYPDPTYTQSEDDEY